MPIKAVSNKEGIVNVLKQQIKNRLIISVCARNHRNEELVQTGLELCEVKQSADTELYTYTNSSR